MLNEKKFISLGESIKAEVLYDMLFDININEFYALDFYKTKQERENLIYNLYRNHIQNAPL